MTIQMITVVLTWECNAYSTTYICKDILETHLDMKRIDE